MTISNDFISCQREQKKDVNSIILVLEYGSIDLAAYLRNNRSKLTQWELRSLWEQMLQAVNVIHNEGIIHSDLKPANFLFIKGKLKLIDFGIANSIQVQKTCCYSNIWYEISVEFLMSY